MSEVTRVYAGRLAGMVVRGPETDVIGRVRDVVVNVRPAGHQSRVLGLVVEMTNKRRIFLPMLRIASIDPHEIMLVSGSVSLRAFKPRTGELTIMGDIIGAKVQVDDPDLPKIHAKPVEVADIEIERTRTRDCDDCYIFYHDGFDKYSRGCSLRLRMGVARRIRLTFFTSNGR